MVTLPLRADPNDVAKRLLDVLQRGKYRLGLESLKSLEATASAILAFVRTNINGYASINVLPVEVLAMIFQQALPSADAYAFNGSQDPRAAEEVRARLALTHVCRRWRRIALDMANLWTVVDEASNEAAAAFLTRSKEMPLQVCIRHLLHRPAGCTLLSHGNRIRDLHLAIPKEQRVLVPSRTMPELLPFDATNLERLSLVTDARPFDDSRAPIPADLDACSALFESPPAMLRVLILRNMSWIPALPLAHLTHLHIAHGTPFALTTLLALLRRCSALTELVLVDVYIADSAAVPLDTAHAVAPPSLRTLVLGINQSHLSMRRVLQFVSLPHPRDAGDQVTLRVSGAYAFRALSELRPFPRLGFTDDLDTLSVDLCPQGDVLRKQGPRGMSSSGAVSPSLTSNNGPVFRAAGPSSALLLDFKDCHMNSHDNAAYLLGAVIPLENIVDVRCRADAVRGRQLLDLLPPARMLALKQYSLVSADAQFLEIMGKAGACMLTMAGKMVLHHHRPGGLGGRGLELGHEMVQLKEVPPDARVCECSTSCELSMKIPRVDPIRHPYDWNSSVWCVSRDDRSA